MVETVESKVSEGWSSLLAFYEQAKSYFAACRFQEETPAFLSQLKERAGADLGVVIINSGKDELSIVGQDGIWLRQTDSLIDILPLLYQSYESVHLGREETERLVAMLFESTPSTPMVETVYFAVELLDQTSLVFVLFRTESASTFTQSDLDAVNSMHAMFEQLVSLSAMEGRGDEVTEQLRKHRKREMVWLESLAWLNELGNEEFNDQALEEFYRMALFQIRLLVSADFTIAFQFQAEQWEVLKDKDDENMEAACSAMVKRLVADDRFGPGVHLKLGMQGEEETQALGAGEVLLYPLFVDNKLAVIYCIMHLDSKFDEHEEMVASLFAEGIGDVTERVYLLRQIRERNEALQQEKEEQQKLINQLSEAQDQLLQQEKMASIGQLAAGVAHEINNPVGYVNSNINSMENYVNDLFGLLDLYAKLEAELPSDHALVKEISEMKQDIDFEFIQDDVCDLISESKEGVSRVKQIVKDLKDFSHVDEAEWQWADLIKGVDSTLNIVHNELKYKAEIVKEYEDLPQVECVPSQVNQVVMNLLVNAGHAIEERGTITIRAKKLDEERVCLEVADTGKGISQENLNKIFNPFFTTKPVGKGTGLGLSLSYSIAEKHGGELSVTSEVGVGTTFRLTLPIRQEDPKAEG